MTLRQKRILRELRHGPLDQMQLAAALDEPPFTVRAELHWLKRERLVRDRHRAAGHLWELTDQGAGITWAADQLTL